MAPDYIMNKGTMPLEAFPYLGSTVLYNHSDWPTVFLNSIKSQILWGMISKVLTNKGAMVLDHGMMYKEVTQTVRMYGRKSGVVTEAMLKILEGFHHQAASQIAWMMTKRVAYRAWEYPLVVVVI